MRERRDNEVYFQFVTKWEGNYVCNLKKFRVSKGIEKEDAEQATYVIFKKIQKQHIQVNKETKIPGQSGLHVRE